MMAAAGTAAASPEAVAVTSRGRIGRAAYSTDLAKRGKGTEQPFGPPALAAFRAINFFIFSRDSAQAVVG